MTARIIEAEYHVQATHFWEVKHIEDWPADEEGEPRDLAHAHDFYIKWGLLHVQWDKDEPHVEYEPTAEDNGDGMDYKWPDREYIDGELVT
jgi:hypothetical protein|tara:strand:+ start:248 stop:520 length:273 start_codon:yes stop_codon:yes gene_type:complete